MEMNNDFKKFASSKHGISSTTIEGYTNVMSNYISPVIPEERRMNVTTMDVFSRLLMDRIIFLGVPINDDVANIIQAQLLYLDSIDNIAIRHKCSESRIKSKLFRIRKKLLKKLEIEVGYVR